MTGGASGYKHGTFSQRSLPLVGRAAKLRSESDLT
jgi:hypothetical protein